jgi:hypothetical protein
LRQLVATESRMKGRKDRLSTCIAYLADDEARCRLHAAASASIEDVSQIVRTLGGDSSQRRRTVRATSRSGEPNVR